MSTFEQRADIIEVTSGLPRPDPAWSYTDEHGHEHRWVMEDGSYNVPLLRWVLDPGEPEFWVDADGDEHNGDGTNRCIICGDEVNPGMTGPSPYAEYIPGLIHCYIDGVEVSKAEFDRRLAEERQ